MICNGTISWVGYLDKLVQEYNNTYHCSNVNKLTHADHEFIICSALCEEFDSSHKAPKSWWIWFESSSF